MNQTPEPRLQTLSPDFTARPGWGGQLKEWFRRRPAVNTVRVLLLLILVLGFVSVLTREAPAEPIVQETPLVPATEGYTVIAQTGQGLANLAEAALGSYLEDNPETEPLAPEQELFVDDALTRTIMSISSKTPFELNPGDNIFFADLIIEQSIWAAQKLSDAQREAWTRVLEGPR